MDECLLWFHSVTLIANIMATYYMPGTIYALYNTHV